MFNLHFSKRNNPCSMKSRNNWIINGPVIAIRNTENGLWLTVRSKAVRSNVYHSDKMKFDCFIPKTISKKKSFEDLHAMGKFEFKDNETYFVVEKIL